MLCYKRHQRELLCCLRAQEAQALRGGSFAQALSEWVDSGGSVGAQTAAAMTVRRLWRPDCHMICFTALHFVSSFPQVGMVIAFWCVSLSYCACPVKAEPAAQHGA